MKRRGFLLSGFLIAALHAGAAMAADENRVTVYPGPTVVKTMQMVASDFNKKNVPQVDVLTPDPARLIKSFCEAPEDAQKLLILSRKLTWAEMNNCEKSGELMGLFLARFILAPVSNTSAVSFNITRKNIYLGIADQVPRSAVAESNLPARQRFELLSATSDSFLVNPFRTWNEIEADLPDVEINFIAPDGGTPKLILDSKVLEAGCRGFKEVKTIFAAEDRTRVCTLYRPDGRVTLTDGWRFEDATKDLLASTKPTIAFVRLDSLNSEGITPLRWRGVTALDADFKPEEFAMRQETSVYFFSGAVRGNESESKITPTAAFLTELFSESVVGPFGAFKKNGFYVLSIKDRMDARAILRRVRGLGESGVN